MALLFRKVLMVVLKTFSQMMVHALTSLQSIGYKEEIAPFLSTGHTLQSLDATAGINIENGSGHR